MIRAAASFAVCLLVLPLPAQERPSPPVRAAGAPPGNWPGFRGERAAGVADGHALPARWDLAAGDQVAFKVPIPGLSHSSPVVFGDQVFVATAARRAGAAKLSSLYGSKGYGAGESAADEGEHEFLLYGIDRGTGRIRFRALVCRGVPKVRRHPKSSHGNPTPACDDERVVVSFGSEGLYCYTHDGRLQWKRDLGVLNSGAPGYPDKTGHQWGFASSPVLHDGRVFVQCDHEGQSFVAAFDAADGRQLWRVARDEDSTWSTPTVYPDPSGTGGQLLLNGYKHIGGYDLATGAVVWKLAGGGDVPVPTPVVADGLVFLTSAHGRARPLRAIRLTARGDLSEPDRAKAFVAWNHPRQGVYMQTPLVYRGLLYACSDGGILTVYDSRTGARIYRQRLGGGTTGFSGSPVAGDGKVYLSGESGEIFVVKAGPQFELLATNAMGENCMATPAIAAGTLLFRCRHHLVAIRAARQDRTP